MMPIKRPDPADNFVGESANEAKAEGPSIEEVVARLKRVRPEVILGGERASPDLAGQYIGRYQILQVVGRGAFGVVYQALDQQLGREVALKVPRPEVLFDEEKLRRFESEAATAATLEHPSIIPIYEADLSGPTPYIASALCVGPDLNEWLAKREGLISVDQAARFVIKLAEAVHYAHCQGVLHRDLKPSNILLEPIHNDEERGNQLDHFEPKLTDFGLAKLLESDLQETRSSVMLGTPRYMAPEQFDKRLGGVGVQSDIYALGAILYELLIGQAVAEGSSHMELMLSILERRVTPPSRIRSTVTPTLEAICLKALEKRPQDRYATSLELAEDLGCYLRGEPTRAKPLGLPCRITKWICLNPLIAGLLSVISISIVGLMLGVSWHNIRLGEQLAVSDQLRIESTESAGRFLRASYVSDMHLAQQAILGGRYSEARSRLGKYQSENSRGSVRDFSWRLLNDQLERTITPVDCQGSLTALASSDQLKALVVGNGEGKLRFFDSTSGAPITTTQAHEGNITSIVFAADATTMISGGDDGMIRVWNTSSLREKGEIALVKCEKAHDDDLLCLAVSPDSRWIASGSADHKVRLWSFPDLKPIADLLGHTDWVRALDFSPDSAFLVSGGHDATIRRWDLETKKEIGQFLGHDKYVLHLKHHPHEPLLVSGGKDRSIRFWNLTTGRQRYINYAFHGWIRSLCFSSDGNKLAVVAEDPRVMLFQRDSDKRYRRKKTWLTDRNAGRGICFIDSDKRIVSASVSGASIWSYDAGLASEDLCVSHSSPGQMIFDSERSRLVLCSNRSAREIDANTGAFGRYFALHETGQEPLDIAVSSAGDLFAYHQNVGPKEQGILNFYVRSTTSKSRVLVHENPVGGGWQGADVSPSGQFVAAASRDNKIRVWEPPNFQNPTLVSSPTNLDFDSFLIDDSGKLLFLQPDNSHELIILDVQTSQTIQEIRNIENLHSRSPDGRLLSIAMSDYSVQIYDAQLRKVVQTLPNHEDSVVAACFSPTEPLVATLTSRGKIALWALDTGEMLMRFQANFWNPIQKGACLTFASDGNALFAAGGFVTGESGPKFTELRVWRLP